MAPYDDNERTELHVSPCPWAKALMWSVVLASGIASLIVIVQAQQISDSRLTIAETRQQVMVNTRIIAEISTDLKWIKESQSRTEKTLTDLQTQIYRQTKLNNQ